MNARLSFKLESEELEQINQVCKHFGLKQSALVRGIVNEKVREILGIGLENVKMVVRDKNTLKITANKEDVHQKR